MFSSLEKDFLRIQKGQGKRSETLRYDKETIDPIIKYFNEKDIKDLDNLKRSDVYDYIDYMREVKQNSETTINKRIAMLKRLIKFAINENNQVITDELNKILKIEKSKVKVNSKHTLTKSEMGNLIKFYDDLETTSFRNTRLKVILGICLCCGFRFNEVRNIEKANVSISDKTIKLTYTKTGKARYGHLTEELAKIIQKYMDDYNSDPNNIYLITEYNGNQLSMNALVKILQRLTNKLKIKISICGLRHTFASYLLMNGSDIETLRRLMGHTRLTTTQIYLDGISDEHVLTQYELSNIFNNKQKYATI